jgi:amino acid transporter
LAHDTFRRTHEENETPTFAIIATGGAAVLPVAVLAYGGSSGLDVYGWMGSLATYGFIVTYALVCIALPRYLRDRGVFHQGAQVVSWIAFVAMLAALAGNLYPVPEGPYGKLPYIFLVYLAAGLGLFLWQERKEKAAA